MQYKKLLEVTKKLKTWFKISEILEVPAYNIDP